MKVSAAVRIALPCIVIGGILGALVGGAFDLGLGAVRAGIVAGGVAAFAIVPRNRPGPD